MGLGSTLRDQSLWILLRCVCESVWEKEKFVAQRVKLGSHRTLNQVSGETQEIAFVQIDKGLFAFNLDFAVGVLGRPNFFH